MRCRSLKFLHEDGNEGPLPTGEWAFKPGYTPQNTAHDIQRHNKIIHHRGILSQNREEDDRRRDAWAQEQRDQRERDQLLQSSWRSHGMKAADVLSLAAAQHSGAATPRHDSGIHDGGVWDPSSRTPSHVPSYASNSRSSPLPDIPAQAFRSTSFLSPPSTSSSVHVPSLILPSASSSAASAALAPHWLTNPALFAALGSSVDLLVRNVETGKEERVYLAKLNDLVVAHHSNGKRRSDSKDSIVIFDKIAQSLEGVPQSPLRARGLFIVV